MNNLEAEQSAMQERSLAARSKQSRKNAGNRKRKRTRVSIKALLVSLAGSPKTASKVRAWAIQQLLLLGGKPVQPFEELNDADENHRSDQVIPIPAFTGADLGTVAPRT